MGINLRLRLYRTRNGILLKSNDIGILMDPGGIGTISETFDVILISHAHSDHVSGINKSIVNKDIKLVMSKETYSMLNIQGKISDSKRIILMKPGDKVIIKGVEITAKDAGHVPGSLQFEIDLGKLKITYTGDLNVEGSNITKPADIPDADILVIDTTYGHPYYIFPPRKKIYEETIKLIKDNIENKTIVLHGYPFGKAQELTKLVFDYTNQVPKVTEKIAQINRIVEKSSNIRLGKYSIKDGNRIEIRSMRSKGKIEGSNKIHLFFTGWAMRSNFKSGFGIPLSSHSSFIKLLEFVAKVQPEKVFTIFGYERSFAEFLRDELEIPSKGLPFSDDGKNLILKQRKGKKVTLDFYNEDNLEVL